MSSDNRYEILYRSLNILICHFMHFLIAKNIKAELREAQKIELLMDNNATPLVREGFLGMNEHGVVYANVSIPRR
ncbi:hypothetical protein PspKH34_25140 [Parageobacillus sp. KH3-4]|nr:hypothetical protein PspKH34_25140 [Parageobacillus sp. KH3-4]